MSDLSASRVGIVMRKSARYFCGDVLDQCPAERNIDHLQPSTDAQYGLVPLQGPSGKGDLQQVALRIDFAERGRWSFTIVLRGDIASAGEEDGVQPLKEAPKGGNIETKGKEDGHSIRLHDSLRIGAPQVACRIRGLDPDAAQGPQPRRP